MSSWLLYAGSGAAMLSIALSSMFVHEDLLRRILGVNIAGSGALLILVAIARRAPHGPPDPVPHALVLTGIVVSVSMTALALSIARRLADHEAPDDAPEGEPAHGTRSGPGS